MLADWNLTVRHGVATIESKPDKGCPQAGFLSPVLLCLVVNHFLEYLQKKALWLMAVLII
jgi:hypothetical protein